MTGWLWTHCRRKYVHGVVQRRSLTSSPPNERFDVLFLGRDEFSCSVLRELHAAKDVWQSITLVTNPDVRTGRRGKQLSTSPLRLLGEELGLSALRIPLEKSRFRYWSPPAPFVASGGQNPKSNQVLVTASFGRILRNRQLDAFSPGRRLNVHPSLLPHYRGPAPIQHALLNGEEETGVSVIEMLKLKDGAVDSGDIWGSEKTRITDGVTFSQLRDILGKQGGRLLASVLREMSRSMLDAKPQEVVGELKAAPMISIADSCVDPTLQTADQIVRIYRALEKPVVLKFHKPGQNQEADGTSLQLHQPEVLLLRDGPVDRTTDLQVSATTTTTPNGPRPPLGFGIYDRKGTSCLIIGCRDETYLGIRSVRQENRGLLNVHEWWNGLNAGRGPIRMSRLP